MSRGRMYEEERLLLWTQEALCEALKRSGISRSELAGRLGVNRSSVTRQLDRERTGMQLDAIARYAYECGFRIVPRLEKIGTGGKP